MGLSKVQILASWDRISELIESGLPYMQGKHSLVDIKESLMNRDRQLWASVHKHKIEAICITSIEIYPTDQKVCQIFLVAGKDYTKWIDFYSGIASWAKGQGCSAVEAYCRPGWTKIKELKDWKRTQIVLRKEL